MPAMDIVWIALASTLAGFIDAIVGGGGLIMVPSLFAAFPNNAPAALFGLNKSISVWGTSMAAWQYQRRVAVPWTAWLPAALAGFAFAFAGAWAVTQIPAEFLRRALPLILLGVLAYTVVKKDLGQQHQPRFSGRRETAVAFLIGASIGFYDGFFGPGTGSFLVFLFVRVLGYDFLRASASAKLINVSTNLAALLLFTSQGLVNGSLALPLAACNVLGSFAGSRLALRHGTGFVRWVFMAVVSALILKTGFDAYGA
jgi:uncharacterized membrane protein YfcA